MDGTLPVAQYFSSCPASVLFAARLEARAGRRDGDSMGDHDSMGENDILDAEPLDDGSFARTWPGARAYCGMGVGSWELGVGSWKLGVGISSTTRLEL